MCIYTHLYTLILILRYTHQHTPNNNIVHSPSHVEDPGTCKRPCVPDFTVCGYSLAVSECDYSIADLRVTCMSEFAHRFQVRCSKTCCLGLQTRSSLTKHSPKKRVLYFESLAAQQWNINGKLCVLHIVWITMCINMFSYMHATCIGKRACKDICLRTYLYAPALNKQHL